MQFTHYSGQPRARVPNADQYRQMTDLGSKPEGLWFCAAETPDEGWEEFVRRKVRAGATSYSLDQIKYRTRVEFRTTSKVLSVGTAEKFDLFTERYSQISYETLERTRDVFRTKPRIDWPRVANDFDAIVIAPLRADRLRDDPIFEWYRCWDVASGCVWTAGAVVLSPA
jgi:hypothetical protein